MLVADAEAGGGGDWKRKRELERGVMTDRR